LAHVSRTEPASIRFRDAANCGRAVRS
jgi:hypothetical protein